MKREPNNNNNNNTAGDVPYVNENILSNMKKLNVSLESINQVLGSLNFLFLLIKDFCLNGNSNRNGNGNRNLRFQIFLFIVFVFQVLARYVHTDRNNDEAAGEDDINDGVETVAFSSR